MNIPISCKIYNFLHEILLSCLITSALPSLGKTYIGLLSTCSFSLLALQTPKVWSMPEQQSGTRGSKCAVFIFSPKSAKEKWVYLKCIRRAKCQRSTILRGACRVSAIVTRQEEGERKLVSGTNIELSPSPPSLTSLCLSFPQPLALKWQRRMRELVVAILC